MVVELLLGDLDLDVGRGDLLVELHDLAGGRVGLVGPLLLAPDVGRHCRGLRGLRFEERAEACRGARGGSACGTEVLATVPGAPTYTDRRVLPFHLREEREDRPEHI